MFSLKNLLLSMTSLIASCELISNFSLCYIFIVPLIFRDYQRKVPIFISVLVTNVEAFFCVYLHDL